MMLSRRLLITTGALAPVAAFAEGGTTKPAPPPPSAIGTLFPLSGAQALLGDESLRGVQLAVDDINTEGGIGGQMVSLATGDALNQAQAGQAAKSLITGGNAGVLLGTGGSALCYPASAAAELAQIPYIELTAPADGITARGFKFLLRTAPDTAMIASVAAGAVAARFAGKKIGLLFNTGATGGAIAAALLAQWGAAKVVPLLVIGYPEDTVDLHEQIGRLRRAGVEILLHAAGLDDALAAFQAMEDGGWRPAAVVGCGDGYDFRETAYALGAAFEGTLIAAAPFYPPRARYIADAYLASYGMAPRSADSLSAYVGAKLVLDRLNTVGGDTTKLLDALRKTDIPAGTLANGWGAAFDKTGQNTRSFATLQQWRGGALAVVP
jgi:branched-chain amino acid transport system substrate-binding protein